MSRFKMNAIDRLFVASESRVLPINSHVIVEWEISEFPLDRLRLEKALEKILLEFPVLSSKVSGCFREPLKWTPTEFIQNTLTLFNEDFDEDREARELARPLDLERGASFRIFCYRFRTHFWRMTMTVHHSLADGSGQSLLFDRFWKYYGGEVISARHELRTITEVLTKLGKSRLWIGKTVHRHFRPWKKIRVTVARLFDVVQKVDLSRQMKPLVIKTLMLRFDPEKWEALTQLRYQKVGPTFSRNDILLTCALRAFRSVCTDAEKPTRVMLPTDLRQSFRLPQSLQNWVSSLPCVFTPLELKSDRLLALVHTRVREGRVLENAIDLVITAGVLTRIYSMKALRRELVRYDLDPRTFYYSFLWSQVRLPEIDWARLELPRGRAWIQGSLLRQPGVGVVLNVEKDSAIAVFEYLDVPGARDRVQAWMDGFQEELKALNQARH